jgi:hypothetical protein
MPTTTARQTKASTAIATSAEIVGAGTPVCAI